jgi:hypothetical protein
VRQEHPPLKEKHMPKWQVSLIRDTSQDAEVFIEAETAQEAEQIFLHEMDRDLIQWREGDWVGDTDIVEILPACDGTEITGLMSQKARCPSLRGYRASPATYWQ